MPTVVQPPPLTIEFYDQELDIIKAGNEYIVTINPELSIVIKRYIKE